MVEWGMKGHRGWRVAGGCGEVEARASGRRFGCCCALRLLAVRLLSAVMSVVTFEAMTFCVAPA